MVDFLAEWCGPCRKPGPSPDKIAVECGEKLDVVKLNVDDNPGIAEITASHRSGHVRLQGRRSEGHVIGAKPKQFFEKEFADVLS